MRQDLLWIRDFLPNYNGVDLLEELPRFDHILTVDACLSGAGGALGNKWYSVQFPDDVLDKNLSINVLELLNVLAALRVFADDLANTTLHIRSDNATAIVMIQNGKGRCPEMLNCTRQIWSIAASRNINFKISHILGVDNTVADILSRKHLDRNYFNKFLELREAHKAHMVEVNHSVFCLQDYKIST